MAAKKVEKATETPTEPKVPETPDTETPASGFFKRHMKKVIGAGIAIVVIGAGIAYAMMTGSSTDAPSTSGDEV